jgi:hypothetical protein
MKNRAIAAIAWNGNKILIVGIGLDQKLYCKVWDGSRWLPSTNAWESLEGGIDSAPVLNMTAGQFRGFELIQVFALGLNYELWTRPIGVGAWPPQAVVWSGLGGVFNSGPAVSQGIAQWVSGVPQPSRIDLIGLGTNNEMFHKLPDPSIDWAGVGGVFVSEAAAVARDFNTLDMFGIGTDGHMYHRSIDANGNLQPNDWVSLEGCFISAPAVASWATSRLDVCGIGTDKQMYHRFSDDGGVTWGPATWWEPIGGRFDSSPTVVSWGPNRLDIFGLGTDDKVYHQAWDGSAWTGWEKVGDVAFQCTPAVVSWGPNRLDVFGIGVDSHMYHAWWGGSWSAWEPLGGAFRLPRGVVLPEIPPTRTFSASFTFPDGVALGGSAQVTFNQDGTGAFSGQFHDSGALSYDVGVAVAIRDAMGRGYAFTAYPHVAGTFDPGSRDTSWNWPFTNSKVASNWTDLCFGCIEARFQAQEGVDGASLLPNILIGVGQVIDVVTK